MSRPPALLKTIFFLVAGVCTASAMGGGVPATVLERPALMTPLASHSMLTAVSTHGGRVLAVGERGHVIVSEDQGNHWLQARVPVRVTLTAVQLVDEKNGWAVGHGGVILRTTDGGMSWTKQLDGRAIGLLLQKNTTGDARESLLREARQWIDDGPDKPILDLHFWDANHGWVVGAYGLALATSDGGVTWTSVMDRIPNPDRRHIYSIRASKGSVYMAGEQGSVYRASERDGKFERLSIPYKGSFFDIVNAPGGAVLALGLRGNLFRSEDNGKTWQRIDLKSRYTLTHGIVRGDGSLLLVDEAGTGWLSEDQGKAFRKLRFEKAFPLSSLVELPSTEMILVGARGVMSGVTSGVTSTPMPETKQ